MSDRKHLVVVLLSAIALIGFIFGVLKPRASEAASLREQLAQAQIEELTLADQLNTLQRLDLNRADLEGDLKKFVEYLPPHAHLVKLVRQFQRAAKIAGVDLRQIAPTQPSTYAEVPGSSSMQVSLVIDGTYDRIESFAAQLEQLPRAVKVTSLTFAPSQDEGGNTSLAATLGLAMYTYNNANAGAPADPASANAAPADPAGANAAPADPASAEVSS